MVACTSITPLPFGDTFKKDTPCDFLLLQYFSSLGVNSHQTHIDRLGVKSAKNCAQQKKTHRGTKSPQSLNMTATEANTKLVASMEGFEPPTTCFVGRYSVHLSYMDMVWSRHVDAHVDHPALKLGDS